MAAQLGMVVRSQYDPSLTKDSGRVLDLGRSSVTVTQSGASQALRSPILFLSASPLPPVASGGSGSFPPAGLGPGDQVEHHVPVFFKLLGLQGR